MAFCTNCGEQLINGTEFCSSCGNKAATSFIKNTAKKKGVIPIIIIALIAVSISTAIAINNARINDEIFTSVFVNYLRTKEEIAFVEAQTNHFLHVMYNYDKHFTVTINDRHDNGNPKSGTVFSEDGMRAGIYLYFDQNGKIEAVAVGNSVAYSISYHQNGNYKEIFRSGSSGGGLNQSSTYYFFDEDGNLVSTKRNRI